MNSYPSNLHGDSCKLDLKKSPDNPEAFKVRSRRSKRRSVVKTLGPRSEDILDMYIL
jgi:hypothetical protein